MTVSITPLASSVGAARRPGPVAGARPPATIDARHRLVAGAAPAVDDDVGLGIDRRAPAIRSASAARGSAVCSSGRPGRSRTRSQSRSRSARSQTEVARASISARVRGSMKAPPPVASTPGRSAEQPRDHPPLAVAEGRLAERARRSPGSSCRPPSTISCRSRRTAPRSSAASRLPTLVLPAPISPTSTSGRGSRGASAAAGRRVAVSRSCQLPSGRARAKVPREAIAASMSP